MEYITQFCLQNNGISQSDVEDCLEDMMEQEFETICEDGSIKGYYWIVYFYPILFAYDIYSKQSEMSALLMKYLTMLQQGRISEIEHELSQLPPNVKWLCQGAPIKFVPIDDSSNDEDIDDEPQPHLNQNSQRADSSAGATLDIDSEWTTVRTRRKNKFNWNFFIKLYIIGYASEIRYPLDL